MSHPVNDEIEEVIGSFFSEFIGMKNRFVDFLHKWERIDLLTRNEAEFLNEISIACQKYIDNEELKRPLSNAEKEELK